MLDIKDIKYWISRYEHEANELNDCVTLSALYAIEDRLSGAQALPPQPQIAAYSETAAPIREVLGQYGDSEFLQAIAGMDPVEAWAIMDEHMDTLRVVNPRVYTSVMQKLRSL